MTSSPRDIAGELNRAVLLINSGRAQQALTMPGTTPEVVNVAADGTYHLGQGLRVVTAADPMWNQGRHKAPTASRPALFDLKVFDVLGSVRCAVLQTRLRR